MFASVTMRFATGLSATMFALASSAALAQRGDGTEVGFTINIFNPKSGAAASGHVIAKGRLVGSYQQTAKPLK